VIPLAHHAGEQLILSAAVGSGLLSATALMLRACLSEVARRRGRRRR
jgi:hypothetical protein